MKNVFFAWTPLQIINNINLYMNRYQGEESLMVLYRSLHGVEELKNKITNVLPSMTPMILDEEWVSTWNFKKILNLKRSYNPFFDEKIDRMFISGDTYFCHLFYAAGKKKNPKMELHYVEDGLGAYIQAPIINNRRWIDKLKNRLPKYPIYAASFDSYHLYQPDLFQDQHSQTIEPLALLQPTNPALKALFNVFNLKSANAKDWQGKKTLIYLDQPFTADHTKINEFNLYDLISSLAQDLNLPLYVKLHPRQDPSPYRERGAQFVQTHLPWELFILAQGSQNLLPIGVNSTALFSPSLLLGNQMSALILAQYVLKNMTIEDEHTLSILKNSLQLIDRIKRHASDQLYIAENRSDIKDSLLAFKQEIDYD